MNKVFLLIFLSMFSLHAENNTTNENNCSSEHNKSIQTKKSLSKKSITEQQVKKQMELEKKYAKEQKFYQGDDYDLKAVEINEKSLEHVPVIEPDYDFDITDVYRDDI